MKKRILSILLTLCMVLCLMPTGVFAEDAVSSGNVDISGSGTAEDPYLIYSAEGLKAFRDKVNGGQRNAFATLMDDIVLNDGIFDSDGKYTAANGGTSEPEKWTPIGTDNNKYNGTFDGNGKTIKGLYVNTESDRTAGLFGSTSGSQIKNLTVDGSVNGKEWVGGISGFAGGCVIENCTNNALVTIADVDNDPYAFVSVGGIAGYCTSQLIGCSNTGKVTAKNISQGANVGGLVGWQSSGIVNDCYNTGAVCGVAGKLYFGGIVGAITLSTTSNCYTTGRLDSTGSTIAYLGGIVGLNCNMSRELELTNSYYLEGTAENAEGKEEDGYINANTVKPMPKEAFEDGTILNLMVNGREDGAHPWSGACGYIESTDMVLPILKRQRDIYGHSHCICSGSTNVGDHTEHTDIDWTPWTSTNSLPTKAGSYYLMNDVTLTYDLDRGGFWRAKENINICLNGKTISSNGYALIIDSSAILSVTDCGGSGKIIGGNIYIDRWSTTNIISSVICESGSVFNLYGGALLMNEEGKGKGMGNKIVVMYTDINFNGAEFNMYGGSIGESSHIGTEDECRYLEAKADNRFNAYGGAIYGPVYFGFRAKINFGNTAFATDVRHRRDYSSDFMGTEPTNFIGDARMVWEYPFHILVGDTRIRIDDRNKNDILGDGSGSLKYEFDENSQIDADGNFNEEKGHGTLTFNNAKLVYDADSDCDVINFGRYFSLDIVLKGKNAIVPDEGEAKGGSIIAGREKLTIKGDGSLDIVSKRSQCIGCGFSLGDENITILTSTNSDGTGAVKTDVGDGGALSAAKYLRIGASHTHCICGNNADSNHSHTDVEWTPWASADSLPSAAGSYYLVDDVTLPTGDITMPDGVNICLNGNSIRSTDADNTKLKVNDTLCITDCETTGNLESITQVSGKLVVWNAEIKSGIYNGEVVNNGKITGGIFYGTVTGTGTIEDSAKRTVTFNSNGGSDVDTQKILRGQKVAEPTDCQKIGHTLTGWNNGENKYSFAAPVLDDLVLSAQWTVNKYTITIKPQNGEKDIVMTVDYGAAITLPTLTKKGYTFIGWDKEIPATMPAEKMTITAQWRDSEKPTGEISVAASSWKTFLNNITFGLFFKDTQTVTITASDNSDETVTVEYLLSGTELTEAELAKATFTAYTAPFGIDPDNKYIVYVRLTDTAGNVSYICSDGIVLDGTTPVISGVENGKIYCEAQTVTIDEKYIDTVTVNGTAVTLDENGSFVLAPADVEQKIVVTDKAGNTAEITVTVNDGHTFGEWASNGDGTHTRKCTVNGCTIGVETENCTDDNKDHKCDVCGATLSECTDTDKDHVCDYCGKTISNHEDADKNHVCDYCGKTITNHDDADKNHVCDYCGKTISNHEDADKNHVCDYCGKAITNHEDADKNHVCDYCGKVISNHEDSDKNHVCDYCGKVISNHEDTDKNHICDYCEKTISNHEDADKNHICDYCGKTISNHEDTDKNHICDYCGKVITNHSGGKATCAEKAVCEICGEKYGELDPDNHSVLKHTQAKAATEETEGNIEYWYCEECGKYYGEKQAKTELTKAETVTEKLPKKPQLISPKTVDNSNILLWFALMFINGGVCTVLTVKRKKITLTRR